MKKRWLFPCLGLGLMLLGCSGPNEENLFANAAADTPKGDDQVEAAWGLNNILTFLTSGDEPEVDCITCNVACDCFDEIVVTAANSDDIDDLDDAIAGGTVHQFFATSNAGQWSELFRNQLCGDVLADLQNGVTTLIRSTASDEAQYGIVLISPANGTITYTAAQRSCD